MKLKDYYNYLFLIVLIFIQASISERAYCSDNFIIYSNSLHTHLNSANEVKADMNSAEILFKGKISLHFFSVIQRTIQFAKPVHIATEKTEFPYIFLQNFTVGYYWQIFRFSRLIIFPFHVYW